jgi:hypothetical protein
VNLGAPKGLEVSAKPMKWGYMCDRGIYFASVSTIFPLHFRTVLAACYFIPFYSQITNFEHLYYSTEHFVAVILLLDIFTPTIKNVTIFSIVQRQGALDTTICE